MNNQRAHAGGEGRTAAAAAAVAADAHFVADAAGAPAWRDGGSEAPPGRQETASNWRGASGWLDPWDGDGAAPPPPPPPPQPGGRDEGPSSRRRSEPPATRPPPAAQKYNGPRTTCPRAAGLPPELHPSRPLSLEGVAELIDRGLICDGRVAAVAFRRTMGILELQILGGWRRNKTAAEVLPRLLATLEEGMADLSADLVTGFCYNAGRMGLAGEPALLGAAKRLAYAPGLLDAANFQQVTNACHGLAKCGAAAAAGAVRAIGDVAATRLTEAKPMELANLCWALGQLEAASPAFTAAWCAELVRRRLRGFNVQARARRGPAAARHPACACQPHMPRSSP
jgi:hypothetical protein